MKSAVKVFAYGALAASLSLGLAVTAHAADRKITNVSYDPTRELYEAYDEAFIKHWKELKGEDVTVDVTHGGSGAQARTVIDGLNADVVTLALEGDIDAIAKKGLIAADWHGKLENNNAPYTSTIVLLVRKGNPKAINDWGDLVKPDIQVITPNPKTSGGARWNFLAAWAWAKAQPGGSDETAKAFVTDLFKHVPVLDTGARGATTTFVQRGIGDVLISWENEAYLALAELGDQFEIVTPSLSILAEPPVAVVDANVDKDGTRDISEEYVKYLYSPEGQAIAAANYYRPFKPELAKPEDVARFAKINLATIADFGGWKEAQPKFFGDGGVFDQIYVPTGQ